MEEMELADGDAVELEGYVSDPVLSGYDVRVVHAEVLTANGETWDWKDFAPCHGEGRPGRGPRRRGGPRS
jgi:hypothetical protein